MVITDEFENVFLPVEFRDTHYTMIYSGGNNPMADEITFYDEEKPTLLDPSTALKVKAWSREHKIYFSDFSPVKKVFGQNSRLLPCCDVLVRTTLMCNHTLFVEIFVRTNFRALRLRENKKFYLRIYFRAPVTRQNLGTNFRAISRKLRSCAKMRENLSARKFLRIW